MRCMGLHTMEVEATGYVRYVRRVDGQEKVLGPYCDEHQVDYCEAARWRERQGEIRELGAVPLDYLERITEAQREGYKVRLRREIERHPGTPEQVADDLLSVILELDASAKPDRLLETLSIRIVAERQARKGY